MIVLDKKDPYHVIHRFDNGYGVSIINNTSLEDGYELATLKFFDANNFDLCYSTPIKHKSKIGIFPGLTLQEVDKIADEVKLFPKHSKFRMVGAKS